MRARQLHILKYTFVVGDFKYENTRGFSSPFAFIEEQRPIEVNAGNYVKVNYCPSNPHKSYFQTSPWWPSGFTMIAGLGIIVMDIFLVLRR
jgi:hypothetical protein